VSQRQPFHSSSQKWVITYQVLCGLALLVAFSGCNSFGNTRLVKELQSENERLLSEFRAQRDRASELEKANQLQAERLAESEKLLARLSQGGGAGRLSSLPFSDLSGTGVGGNSTNPSSQLPGAGSPVGVFSGSPGTAGSAGANPGSANPTPDLRWQPRYGR
jgi:hypothetical protein